MSESVEVQISTTLAAPCEQVWRSVSTMAGVNAELMPLLRMTYPPTHGSLDGQRVEPGELLFRSWLLALGVVPFDRHSLVLSHVEPGKGFLEESTSWLQSRWCHRRTLDALEGGRTRLTDSVLAEPRLRVALPLVGAFVRIVFRHRHRRLARRFGRQESV